MAMFRPKAKMAAATAVTATAIHPPPASTAAVAAPKLPTGITHSYLTYIGMRSLCPAEYAVVQSLHITLPSAATLATTPVSAKRTCAAVQTFERRVEGLWHHIMHSPLVSSETDRLRRNFVKRMRGTHRLVLNEAPWPTEEQVALAKQMDAPIALGPRAKCYATGSTVIGDLSYVSVRFYPLKPALGMVLSTSLVTVAQLLIWMAGFSNRCEVVVDAVITHVKSAAYRCPKCTPAEAKCACSSAVRFMAALKHPGLLRDLDAQYSQCEAALCHVFRVPLVDGGAPAPAPEDAPDMPADAPQHHAPYVHWLPPPHTVEELTPTVDMHFVPSRSAVDDFVWPPEEVVSRAVVNRAREADVTRAALYCRARGVTTVSAGVTKRAAEWVLDPRTPVFMKMVMQMYYSPTMIESGHDAAIEKFKAVCPNAVMLLNELTIRIKALPDANVLLGTE